MSSSKSRKVAKENGLIEKSEMDNRRKAILKFWKDVQVVSPSYTQYLAREVTSQAKNHIPNKVKEDALKKGVYEWAKNMVQQLFETLGTSFEGLASTFNANFFKSLIKEFYQSVLSNVWSIARPVKDILKGLVAVSQKFLTKIALWRNAALVRIGDGHPRVLCDAIQAAINKGLLADMANLAYSAVQTAGVITSCGLTEVVVGIVDALKALGTFVWRCLERRWIQRFIQECGHQYDNRLYENKTQFALFLRHNLMRVPYLAAVTMHTGQGVVGSMGHFFLFATPDGRQKMGQQEFNATVAYMLTVRATARSLIDESKLKLTSDRSSVRAVLTDYVESDAYYMRDDNYQIAGYDVKKNKRGWF